LKGEVGTDWETAHALLAVASATADTSLYSPAANKLRSHQATNGAWGDDAYTTALALRALHYVKRIQFAVEPDKGILMGSALTYCFGLLFIGATLNFSAMSVALDYIQGVWIDGARYSI
jgi:hypothetical protein